MDVANITLLFTDIVDSTALSQQLSAEETDTVRRRHFSLLRQAVAQSGGTEVKSLGDGLMVVFESPSAAMGCAVAMQQAVERDNRLQARPVSMRVGISAGEVTVEEGDYYGDAVVEAARLCDRCEAGQILCADVVRAVAGRRNRQQCRPVGPMALKGLPDPVNAVEVAWEPLAAEETLALIPLPGRLGIRPAVGVVGRSTEIEAIAEAIKRVDADRAREILLVSGEAGLGKTTLVAEAARRAFDDGAVVLFGHCEEDLATPYQLFSEALSHYVSHAPEDYLRAYVETHGSDLARLVPALARRIPDLPPTRAADPETERFLLFAAAVGLLATVSQWRPVVLVFDDLQWADKGSLLLLRHLASVDQPMRVLVLGIYRDTELPRANALRDALGVLRRHSGLSRVELGGLDDQGVLSFVEAAAGRELDDAGLDLARALYRETDGNPFFVGEVLLHLAETGAVFQDAAGRWVAGPSLDPGSLPDSVREVVGGRVVRLGDRAERVLSAAAVIGRDFDLDLLAAATGRPEDELLDILDDAAAAALVREIPGVTGRYNFSHALIQHTLYEDLGPTRRARVHRQVGEALEILCGDNPGARVGELARHWVCATQTVDLHKAIGYSRQAGDAALGSLAPADALRYYAQALDLCATAGMEEAALRIDLSIGLGTAQRQTGDLEFRDTLLDAARRALAIGDTDRLVAAALATNRGFFSMIGTVDPDKVEMLEQAIDRLPPSSPDRALALAALCSELAVGSPLERRKALAEEALAIAEAHGDDVVTLRVLNNVAFPLMVPPLTGLLLERTAEALERAERLGDPLHRYFAAYWRTQVALLACDVDEMDSGLALERTLAEQLDQPLLNWTYTFARAWRALVSGATDEAESLAHEALQIGTDGGQPDANLIFGGQLVNLNHQRGTLGELVALIEQLVIGAPEVAEPLYAALTLARAEAGNEDEARRLLERLAARGFEIPMDPIWTTGMGWYAAAVIATGDPAFAGPLYEQLQPWADQYASNGGDAIGPLGLFVGGLSALLGRHDEAEFHFRRMEELTARVGAVFDRARNDLWWGSMLVRRGEACDEDAARMFLGRALGEAKAHGYGFVERRAAAALAALGT